jgi:hypothetical protein
MTKQQPSGLVENYGHFSGFIPGLNFIRNQVIKPLLFATEKVFDSYITEQPGETDVNLSSHAQQASNETHDAMSINR